MNYQLALITGATSGIGKALCYLFARQGIDLIITGRTMCHLMHLKEELGPKVGVQVVACDLEKREERARLIEVIHEKCPDLVINNAGFGLYGEALTYSTSEQMSMLDVNGKAVLELTLESARTLISKNKPGLILNMSSAAAFQIFPTLAVYASVKAFVSHFSQSLDFEFRAYGVRVLTACPGMVDTPFQAKASGNAVLKKEPATMSAEKVAELIWRQIKSQTPLVIMDWKYRFLTALSKLIPKNWLATMLSKNILARIKPRKVKKIE
jgi:hypothetical protein